MDTTEVLTPNETQPRPLTPEEAAMTDNVMRHCLAVEPNERVVVLADHASRSLGDLFYAGALRHARDVRLVVMPVAARNGSGPPAVVAEELRAGQVCLLPVTRSLTHTRARRRATEAGARVASMPSLTQEMAMRTLSVDYTQIAADSRALAERISRAETLWLTSPGGCDLRLSVRGREALADTGLFVAPGMYGNLPAGEAFVAPVEGSAQGVLVIDAESIVPEVRLGDPTVIQIRDGLVTAVDGTGKIELEGTFANLGDGARNVAELGIGTNPAARLTGNLLEGEKVVGTAHVALGNNAHFGGTVEVPFHNDGVIARPTIYADGVVLIVDGALLPQAG